MPRSRRDRSSGLAAGIAALVASAGLAGAAPIASVPRQPDQRSPVRVQPGPLTGRDFGGMRLPIGAIRGRIRLAAVRAWLWREDAAAGGAPVQRIVLDEDVRIGLGLQEFSARKAVVWIQRIQDTDGHATYQVFVYFDHVSTPAASVGLSVQADRLTVDGVIVPTEPVSLRADLTHVGRPSETLVAEGESALAEYLYRVAYGEPERKPTSPGRPGEEVAGAPEAPGVERAPHLARPDLEPQEPSEAEATPVLPPAEGPVPIFARSGVISLSAGTVKIQGGPEETVAMATGGAVVEYWDRASGRTLQISAERAVAFLAGGSIQDLARLRPEQVRGIYLEGDVVASDGQYTLRGPRIYYDVQRNRAVVVDAVFWTYNERLKLPLYLRAKTIRQESANEFRAERGTLANTAFAKPHLSVGVRSVTVKREPRRALIGAPEGQDPGMRNIANARGITLRAGSVPFFYWPRYHGDPQDFPLRSVGIENSSESGFGVQTSWDLYALLGRQRPEDLDVQLIVDVFERRGIAIGTDTRWKRPGFEGSLFAYWLPSDNGEDSLSSGTRVDRDGESRGIILGEHRWDLSDTLTFEAEGAFVSDENLVDSLFERLGQTRREFASSLYLRQLKENTAFTAEVRGQINDFTPNEYLLQSQGYAVERLPEFAYYRQADDLLGMVSPGLLSYTSEYRYSRLRLDFTKPTARSLGFTSKSRALEALGIEPDMSPADLLRASGLNEAAVNRLDTRHEITSQFNLGPVRINPFAVGRVTAYDSDFSGLSPAEQDNVRLWGAVGVRASTSLQRVYNGVDSRLLDLHRLRHIIEPSVTIWHADTTVDQKDLPVFDFDVDSIANGTVLRFGLDQVWQTQRGGPGRWHNADVLTISTEAVVSTSEGPAETPIGRFFDYRPELSILGDYATIDATWQITDSVALAARSVYDFNTNQQAITVAGLSVNHTPQFRTYGDLRFINALNTTFVNLGAEYELTPKYTFDGRLQFDEDEGDIKRISGTLERRFPNLTFGLRVTFDNIRDETSIGVILRPLGFAGAARIQGIGASGSRQQRSTFGR